MKKTVSLFFAYFAKVIIIIGSTVGALLVVAGIIYSVVVIKNNTHNFIVNVPDTQCGIALALLIFGGIVLLTGIMVFPYVNKYIRALKLFSY